MNVVEFQRLLAQHRCVAGSAILPCGDVGVMLIVTLGFAIGCLILLAEVTAAGLVAVEGVDAHELGELKEVGHAAGLFQALIQVFAAAPNV